MPFKELGVTKVDVMHMQCGERIPNSDVHAHLRLFPRHQGTFRVVLTFRPPSGSLCEVELSSPHAADLVAEITRTIDQGNLAVLCEQGKLDVASNATNRERRAIADVPDRLDDRTSLAQPAGNSGAALSADGRPPRPKLSLRLG